MSFSGLITIPAQELNTISSTKLHGLGALTFASDGRAYRYCLAGASNLAVGKATIAAAKVTNHTNISLSSDSDTAVGSKHIRLTLGNTAATQDQYVDGYLVFNDGTGAGTSYQIEGNGAASGNGVIDVYLAKPLQTAISTSDTKGELVSNPWANVIVAPGDASTYAFTGVPGVAVTAANYYWSQTGGMASVLSDGIVAKNTGAILSASVSGALVTEATGTIVKRIAYAPEATVDTKYYAMFLTAD